ncbi:MAG: MBL fold metallo-hydrolase [Hyphomicrobiaceae bacterium]|nr:MBL fold metallo-hydrolase [Hyphomicrobiaceae bacterium]
MKVTVIGSGDAFGSGGRLQTCFHVATPDLEFLIDCGATAMIGFNGLGLDPNRVSIIFISHLHGDHYSGLVWWLLHARHVAQRTAPIEIVGPAGLEERYLIAAEALFPGATSPQDRFKVTFHELHAGEDFEISGITVKPFEVCHPSGAPSLALRLDIGSRRIGFSGDTEWVEELVDVADGADLYITECYGYETPTRYHMNWRVISENLDRLRAKRVLVTHMSRDMLDHAQSIADDRVVVSDDGLVLTLP